METREEANPAALRLFGREPSLEDVRCVGRWSYAAAWLAADRAAARELAAARLALAARGATGAAMGAGRGDAERFALVSALARVSEAVEGKGALAPAVALAIDEEAARLFAWGNDVRTLVQRERAAFAPKFDLGRFDLGLRDTGADRNVFLREAAAELDEALLSVRTGAPALRTLRTFLRATLDPEARETPPGEVVGAGEPLATLGHWLAADLALAARKATAYGAAWANAARGSGDALSRTLAGLTSGAMSANGVVEALADDPWALVLVLAMTTEAEHASATLDCAVQAQLAARGRAEAERARWAAQAQRVDDLEERLGLGVVATHEVREGHRDLATGPDLFAAWAAQREAESARAALRDATERSLGAETGRQRDAVRRAKGRLEGVRRAYEAALEAAKGKQEAVEAPVVSTAEEDAAAHRGCLYGFGAGCSVMATYVLAGIVLGTAGLIGQIGPLVAGVAALPVLAAIMVQVAYALRRSARSAEAARRRSAASAEFERARKQAEQAHGPALARERATLEGAEASLGAFERRLAEARGG